MSRPKIQPDYNAEKVVKELINAVVESYEEVMHSANISYLQNRSTVSDNRLMIYFQGMKIYIPEGFQADTLLKLLQTLKKLC